MFLIVLSVTVDKRKEQKTSFWKQKKSKYFIGDMVTSTHVKMHTYVIPYPDANSQNPIVIEDSRAIVSFALPQSTDCTARRILSRCSLLSVVPDHSGSQKNVFNWSWLIVSGV